jgi:glycosyltransferase involved in cell wall biosynthesis
MSEDELATPSRRGKPRKVSVIVPTRDRPDFLEEALTSIRAIEAWDLVCEILVCDNGTHPDTPVVAERFGARYFRVERPGAAATRNAGLRAATGDYIAHLDDDDLWTKEHVRPHLALMEAHPNVATVVGQIQCTGPDRELVGPVWPTDLPEHGDFFMTFMSYFPQVGGTVSRISVRESVGEFDETLLGDADWDWQLRIAKRHRVGFVPVPSVLFRQRPPGSADKVHLKRIPHTRRIFFRHALPEWKRWDSPREFLRTYNQTMSSYYAYFAGATVERARSGNAMGALDAARHAFAISPGRGLREIVTSPDFRSSVGAALKQLASNGKRRP